MVLDLDSTVDQMCARMLTGTLHGRACTLVMPCDKIMSLDMEKRVAASNTQYICPRNVPASMELSQVRPRQTRLYMCSELVNDCRARGLVFGAVLSHRGGTRLGTASSLCRE
jgi:hypothetical protein